MKAKLIVAAVSAAALLLVISADKGGSPKIVSGFVELGGVTYYIDERVVFRDDAQLICESVNMTLVSWESAAKYFSFNEGMWALGDNYWYSWYWTSGVKDPGDTHYYWQATGENITELWWGEDAPLYDQPEIRLCLIFHVDYGGWDNDKCDNFFEYNPVCEYK